MNEIGDFLKALRKSKGLTQAELADMLNVSNKTVSKWENGLGIPEMSTLVRLADLYDVLVDDILRGSRKMLNNEDKTIKRLEYISHKSKNQYQNHVIINIGILAFSVIVLFVVGSLTNNSTGAMGISLALILLAIVLQIFSINRIRYQIIELEEILKVNIQKFVFNTSVIVFGLSLWISVFSLFYNVGTTVVPNSDYIMSRIVPSLAVAVILTLSTYLIIRFTMTLNFIGKPSKTSLIFSFVLFAILIVPYILLQFVSARDLAIKLDHRSMSYSIFHIDEKEERYYELKLLAIIDEKVGQGIRPTEIFEVKYNPDTYRDEIHYVFDDSTGYHLIKDFEYFYNFLMELGYSNFEIDDKVAKAYFTVVSNQQLSYEVYSFITGIILKGCLLIFVPSMFYIFIKGRNKEEMNCELM